MAISPAQEEAPAGRDYSLQPPPHTLRPFGVPSWPLMASKDAANVRRAYIAVAAHSRTASPSVADFLSASDLQATDTSNDGTTSLDCELVPSTRSVLPAVEAESLSTSVPGYDRTGIFPASLDHVQDVAPPTAVRRHKGRKDIYLCYKDPQSWFSHQGDAFSPHQLPFLFKNAISARGKEVSWKIRVMVCEGRQLDLDAEEGDVLIFPDMVQYKSSLVCDESDAAVFINMLSGKTKTIEEVLQRHLEKRKDHSNNKHWLLHSLSLVKTSYALVTSLSVMVAVGTLVAFKVYKKADTSRDVRFECPKA